MLLPNLLKAALNEQRLLKVIAGLANFDPASVAMVARAAAAGGADLIDVACDPAIVQLDAAESGLPICVSAVDPELFPAAVAAGATLLEIGDDYEDARVGAEALAAERGLEMVSSFNLTLVCGVATYALEFFRHCPPLERVYVGIGLGSGASGLIAARDALGLNTEIVGVVAEGAPCYSLSLAAGAPVATAQALTIAHPATGTLLQLQAAPGPQWQCLLDLPAAGRRP
jgi:hypothetical protein